MKRRQFISIGTRTALLGYFSSVLPSHAFAGPTGAQSVEKAGAFNPVYDFVQNYQLPQGRLSNRGAQRLVYDVITWKNPKRGEKLKTNDVSGHLILTRKPSGGYIDYQFDQKIDGHTWNGNFKTKSAPWRPLMSWELAFSSEDPIPAMAEYCKSEEIGKVDGNQAFVKTDNYIYKHALTQETSTPWSLFDSGRDFLAIHGKGPASMDHLYELSQLRPQQTIEIDSKNNAFLDGTDLKSFLLTGEGSLPTHYMVDAEGRVLFATVLMTSFALRSIETL